MCEYSLILVPASTNCQAYKSVSDVNDVLILAEYSEQTLYLNSRCLIGQKGLISEQIICSFLLYEYITKIFSIKF